MRVVVLAEASGAAVRVLLHLALRGTVPTAVLLASRPRSSVVAEATTAVRTRSPRRLAGALIRRIASVVDQPARMSASQQLDGLTERVVATTPLNSDEMVRALEELAPEVLVLAATGLVTETVLRIPTVATLNSHPGLLPWVRGNGAVDQAIRRGIPVGVSVHHVDKGVDTGNFLQRRLVPVTPIDSVGSLRLKAEEIRWLALAEVVTQFASGNATLGVPQSRRFPLCKWPSNTERFEAESLVRNGVARQLYLKWREASRGDLLPNDDDVLPAPAPESNDRTDSSTLTT